MPTPPLAAIPEDLLSLAPLHLQNHRGARYDGGSLCVSLDLLAARDQELLLRLYERLTELLYVVTDTSTDDAGKWEGLADWTALHDLDRFIDEVRELGLASHGRQPAQELSMAMHDVRGGALSALLGRLQLLDHLPHDEGQLGAIFIQTRDHLKIMRNALNGLDEPRRRTDCKPRAHTIQLILDKWHEAVVGPNWRERPLRLEIDCRYAGTLTECCLESAAIDRIFYNLSNNACRHAVSDRLEMVIFPLPDVPGECLRFVLSNEVGPEGIASLRTLVPVDARGSSDGGERRTLPHLFQPTVSSTGSGFGLTVVADFVAEAFGLTGRADALRDGYVGAVLDGGTFRAWFHWPIARGDLPEKLDDYRQPARSLTEAE